MTATNKIVRMEQLWERDAGKSCVAASEAVALIRDKWTILVLGSLRRGGSLRYTELQRRIDGISQRMLTLTLKTLEENGLVTRTVFASVPPRVDYALTPLGQSLSQPLKALLEWSMEHRADMAAARRAYRSRPLPARAP